MATVPQPTTVESSTLSTSTVSPTCAICFDPLEIVSIGVCNHASICHRCTLRMRVLRSDCRCPLCKTELPFMIFTPYAPSLSFPALKKKRLVKDKEWNVFATSADTMSTVTQLRQFRCPVSGCTDPSCASLKRLKAHVQKDHGSFYCDLCLSHSSKFISEETLYPSRNALNQHVKAAHPDCRFCHKSFYSEDEIFQHMNQEHERCFLCERRGQHYVYYKDYPGLEQHFRNQHYLCEDPHCLQSRFVVFATDLELVAHRSGVHGIGRPSITFRSGQAIEDVRGSRPRVRDDAVDLTALARAFPASLVPDQQQSQQQLRQQQQQMQSQQQQQQQQQQQEPQHPHQRSYADRRQEERRQRIAAIGGMVTAEAFPSLAGGPAPVAARAVEAAPAECMIPRSCGHPAGHRHHTTGNCPPCNFPVAFPCCGGHTTVPTPCHVIAKHLRNATTTLSSTTGSTSASTTASSGTPSANASSLSSPSVKNTEPLSASDVKLGLLPCHRPCGQPLSCGHTCHNRCHPLPGALARPTPCGPCRDKVQASCPCGHLKKFVLCVAPASERTLACTKECRNARLRAALQLDEHKLTTDEVDRPPYSEYLIQFAQRDPSFVRDVVDKMHAFVATSKERFLNFRPMNAEKRAFVHQLAPYYFVDAEAQDPEPKRSVVVYRTPQTCLPPYTVFDAITTRKSDEVYKRGLFKYMLVVHNGGAYVDAPLAMERLRLIDSAMRKSYGTRCFVQVRSEYEMVIMFTDATKCEEARQKLVKLYSDLKVWTVNEQEEGGELSQHDAAVPHSDNAQRADGQRNHDPDDWSRSHAVGADGWTPVSSSAASAGNRHTDTSASNSSTSASNRWSVLANADTQQQTP